MKKTAPALAALLLLALTLAACGGGGSSEPTTTSEAAKAPEGSTAPKGSEAAKGKEQAKAKPNPASAAQNEAAAKAKKETPASLATDPASIKGARVTATGAVQTLPPKAASHAEAMENSYSSIKAFGEESEGSEATDITYALVQYLTAKANGDSATACARLYTPLRENLAKMAEGSKDPAIKGGGCPAAYAALMARSSQSESEKAAKIDVASVRRGEGNRAFVIYKTPNTLSADMPLYLDGGVWTVGALEGYVLTAEELAQNQG